MFPFLLSLYLRVPLPCQGLPRWHRIHLPMKEMQETLVRSLGQEDPLEKRMANHSSILAWRIPWTKEPRRLQSMGLLSSDMTEQIYTSTLCLPQRPYFPIILGSHICCRLGVLPPRSPASCFGLFSDPSFVALDFLPCQELSPFSFTQLRYGRLVHLHPTWGQASGVCFYRGSSPSTRWPAPSFVNLIYWIYLDAKQKDYDLFHFCFA